MLSITLQCISMDIKEVRDPLPHPRQYVIWLECHFVKVAPVTKKITENRLKWNGRRAHTQKNGRCTSRGEWGSLRKMLNFDL